MTSDEHGSSLLTVPETAERLRVSEVTVRRLVRAGDLPALRVGHQIRVSARELDDWLFESCGGSAYRRTPEEAA